MILGSEVLLNSSKWLNQLKKKRVAYLGNSASLNQKGELILSLIEKQKAFSLTCLLSPQHGFFSNKQANMITTEDSFYKDIKLYSLYSEKTRRLTKEMKKQFDILLFDLQDVGCRIYTYLSTLFYLIEDLDPGQSLIVLDRPNPLGRYVEGSLLKEDFKSFVGVAPMPMSYGLTLGESALWYKTLKNLKTELHVIPMADYYPSKEPWSQNQVWTLPSPNMTGLSCAKVYPGSVLLEGTPISEGRGTTLPFEMIGYPEMQSSAYLKWLQQKVPDFLKGCFLRSIQFEPTFDKFKNQICSGFQIHLERSWAKEGQFQPYRLISGFLKAFKELHPSLKWKIAPPYEYEYEKEPIDIISGGKELQKWIEDSSLTARFWDDFLREEEENWKKQQKQFFLYP